MIGQTILHYRVTERLGAGGMGVVYAAEDLTLRRPVALKFVPEELARDPQALERLRVEARAASALNHANICTIYAVEEYENQPFIVMELLKGRTLRERMHDGNPMKVMQILDIGIQAADALDAAHASGIIHRDIKPANIFMNDRGRVKILDFGVAKFKDTNDPLGTRASTLSATALLTPGGMALGTVAYMSPEQATGEPLDGRTDLFSLGVVLYEAATGRHPFPGKTSALVLSAILNKAPASPGALNPDLPVRLQEVIANCLEKDPELRYQAAGGLRADLKRVKRDLESGMSGLVTTVRGTTSQAIQETVRPDSGTQALPPSAHATPPPAPAPSSGSVTPAGRPPLVFLAAAAVLVAAVVGGTYLFRREPPVAVTAERGLDVSLPANTTASPTPDPAALAAAQASLDRRDYRTALAQAAALLQQAPGDASAAAVWDAARAAIDQLEQALADADRLLAAGNADGAAAALERARAIDPTAPRLSELSSQLVRLRGQSRARAATPPAAAPPPTPAPAPAPIDAPATPPPSPPATSVTAPPIETRPAAPPTTAPAEPAPVRAVPPAAASPSAAAAPTTAAPAVVNDDAAIRQVVATYARAIETKDVALFRSVKPNLSAEEERRLVEGFRAVGSQHVDATVLGIERQGARATVRLRRRDTISSGGRTQTADSEQTITMARDGDRWMIERIGQ